MFGKWYCSHCNKKHSKKIPVAFHWQGFWEQSKEDYCEKFIIKSNNDFEYDNESLTVEYFDKLNINQQIKIARDILNGYGFRRQSNGESIYTEIINVLRIENGKLICKVHDEYGNILDLPMNFLTDKLSLK